MIIGQLSPSITIIGFHRRYILRLDRFAPRARSAPSEGPFGSKMFFGELAQYNCNHTKFSGKFNDLFEMIGLTAGTVLTL